MAEPFISEIRIFCGSYAPYGWHFCDGTELSIADNTALFSLIGTAYGGDGRVSFALPDFRGRIPLHYGTGPGLINKMIGSRSGAEKATIVSQQIPAHSHSLMGVNSPADTNSPSNASFADCEANTFFYNTADTEKVDPLNARSISSAGEGQAHENRMAYMVVNYIIALDGEYPSRS